MVSSASTRAWRGAVRRGSGDAEQPGRPHQQEFDHLFSAMRCREVERGRAACCQREEARRAARSAWQQKQTKNSGAFNTHWAKGAASAGQSAAGAAHMDPNGAGQLAGRLDEGFGFHRLVS